VILSTGLDSGSKYAFADVLDYARRTGVTIYTSASPCRAIPPRPG